MIANPSFFAPNTIVSPTQPTLPPSIATINPPTSTPAAPITPIPDPIPPTSITPVTEHSTPPNPATNTHPMTTRAKSGIFKSKALLTEMTPRCTMDALQNPQWLAAMKAKYMALMQNNTWDLVPLPPHKKAIGSKWIYCLKYNADGSVVRHKARLVA